MNGWVRTREEMGLHLGNAGRSITTRLHRQFLFSYLIVVIILITPVACAPKDDAAAKSVLTPVPGAEPVDDPRNQLLPSRRSGTAPEPAATPAFVSSPQGAELADQPPGTLLPQSDSPPVSSAIHPVPSLGTVGPSSDLPSQKPGKSQSAKTDRQALITLYHATNGPKWYVHHSLLPANDNWLSNLPLGEWQGVTTDENGRVVSLDLTNVVLNGTIPPEIGNLSEIRRLLFWGEGLQGKLPGELGNLLKLEELQVSGTKLTDPIPSELGNLTNLKVLNLRNNFLAGSIPPELGELSGLTGLWLNNNSFSGPIPVELGNLSNLNWLELSSNLLRGTIPAELGDLKELVALNLGENTLEGQIPHELGNLYRLDFLGVSHNDLSGEVPEELGSLAAIRSLDLSHNNLTGSLPPGLAKARNLTYLNLDYNGGLCVPPPMEGWPVVFADYVRACGSPKPALGNPNDREILVAFYNATNGPNWENNQKWLTGQPLDHWYGVDTDEEGNVTGLFLSGNGLQGTLPSELGGLSSLTHLDLGGNYFPVQIPDEIGNLSNLTHLNISRSSINGNLPPTLGNLSNLIELKLSGYRSIFRTERGLSLEGQLPPSLSRLTKLNTLEFEGNDGLCSPIEMLAWLLEIAEASGSVCPAEPSASGLTMPDDPGIRSDWEALVALYNALDGNHWWYHTNWLHGKPLGDWQGVTTNEAGRVIALDLSFNHLRGTLPAQVGKLTQLERLNLASNQLTGRIPAELSEMVQLVHLNMAENELSGPIPPEIGELTSLSHVNLKGNKLNGRIPPEIAEIDRLNFLDLVSNDLTGSLPQEFQQLTNLEHLQFANNSGLCAPAPMQDWIVSIRQAAGPVCPQEASAATSMEDSAERRGLIALYDATGGSKWKRSANWLTDRPLGDWHGVVTNEQGRVSELQLAGNNLNGPLPPQLGDLTSLTGLYLYQNSLTGTIPPELGDLTGLTSLELFDNNLTGPVPPELGNLTSLTLLTLDSNNLHGQMPESLSGLENLLGLHFSKNDGLCVPPSLRDWFHEIRHRAWGARGPICAAPSEAGEADRAALISFYHSTGGPYWKKNKNWLTDTPIWGWHGVTTDSNGRVVGLHLVSNNLVGHIPPELGNLSSLSGLSLGYNSLTGPIPQELANLHELTELDLSSQYLTGPIPPGLGNLTALTALNLADNNLTGVIPGELANAKNLKSAFLSGNYLTGTIPHRLGNLSSLEGLYIGNNQLEGQIPESFSKLGSLRSLYFKENVGLCLPPSLRSWYGEIGSVSGPTCP